MKNSIPNIDGDLNKREQYKKALGFTAKLASFQTENGYDSFAVGRVSLTHKDRYIVLTEDGEIEAELLGNLRYSASSKSDLPAVGDWVAMQLYDDKKGLIHAVFPRENALERQAVGRSGEKQLIATNIDCGLIVQAVNRDLSINRLERYVTICHAAKIEPIVILNKLDLIDQVAANQVYQAVKQRLKGITILRSSNLSGQGIAEIQALIEPGKTYCLLGSSGVGKSTLINHLLGEARMATGQISESVDRGKHVTTHRELILLSSGGIIIDNPGMREVGITENEEGLAMTFDEIYELSEECKFKDCSHRTEKGCAVLAAIETGDLDEALYQNFLKMEREQAHFSTSIHEKRKKEKIFGKLVKEHVRLKNQNKL